MLSLIIFTNLVFLVMGQNLCTQQQGTPVCASQFNGNYINCYCVVDPNTNTAIRRVTLDKSSDDLNLCQNSNQNTFCCPYNFLNRENTFTFNGFIYDRWCNNIGATTPTTSIQLSTTNVEAFVTLYVTPASTTDIVPTTVTEYVPTTVTTLVPTLVQTTVTTLVPTLVPTTVTAYVPTTVTEYVPTPFPTTVTSYISEYPNAANLQAPLPTSVPTVTVTKTLVKPRYITKTRIVKITN